MKYHTFWPRFWAGWIDSLVLLPLWFADFLIWANVSSLALLVPWYLFYAVVEPMYTIGLHAKYGQTIGKMVMGVKVLDISEQKLSLKQAVLRDIVPLVLTILGVASMLPSVVRGINPYSPEFELTTLDLIAIYAGIGWALVELVTMLSNPKRRAIHDFIAGSVVVRLRGLPETPEAQQG